MEKQEFKKYKIDGRTYYLAEKGNMVAVINSESYHKPLEKYLNKRFCFYIYEKKQNWDVSDYVNSHEYVDYDILPTLRECKDAVQRFYFSKK